MHLLVNASVLNGPAAFQANVDRIHSLGHALPVVEWAFIFLPILFHAALGLVIIAGASPNAISYPLLANLRYVLQRVTGLVAFAFILAHVAHMHTIAEPLQSIGPNWFAQFDPHDAAASAAATMQGSLLVPLVYLVGILVCVFHLANGLWTIGITWGVWTTPTAQRRGSWLCAVLGIGLALVGIGALGGLMRFDGERRHLVEEQRMVGVPTTAPATDRLQTGEMLYAP
jgi:succinate dehydrogenase / fumarate reductase cytochrome b subunit